MFGSPCVIKVSLILLNDLEPQRLIRPYIMCTVKTCVKLPLSKRPKIGFQDQLSLNTGQKYCRMLDAGQKYCRMLDAGQKYCRMLPGEHSAILSTFIKLPFVIKIFVLSIFERLLYTGFTVFKFFITFTSSSFFLSHCS